LAQNLRERGYGHVWALEGGLEAWEDAGLPLAPKEQAA
jgi:rhodanese-related sulfurtransferase